MDATVSDRSGPETVAFLLDSGLLYSVLPAPIWRRLGVARMRTQQIRRSDGTLLERGLGQCQFALDPEHEASTVVVLGESEDLPLLGSLTLAQMGLVLDPLNRRLRPMVYMAPGLWLAGGPTGTG